MEYRHLGRAGIQVSVLGLGSWMTFGSSLTGKAAEDMLSAAYEGGINFFDCAESYGAGQSERILGRAFKNLGWPRHSYIVTTKFFHGIHEGVNTIRTLNRKYLLQGIDASLERLDLDFVDIVYCHRPDPSTPLEEVVWAMSDIVSSGKATYWGTSEFPPRMIEEMFAIAERHHLHAPIVEQTQYHLLDRERVEQEFRPLYAKFGLGVSSYAPLASGTLTGKYLDVAPEGSRGALGGEAWLKRRVEGNRVNERIGDLLKIAEELGCTPAQFAIAWCVSNPRISTVITGARTSEQMAENLASLDVVPLLTADVTARIDTVLSAVFTAPWKLPPA